MSTSASAQAQVLEFKSHQKEVSKEAGHWPRVYTTEGIHPFDQIEWVVTDAEIRRPNGEVTFHQAGIEVPAWWSQNAINTVAEKYFRYIDGTRERSVKQMITRVTTVIRQWAESQSYFNTPKDAQIFEHELIFALIHQYGAFNSPVWFNLGVPGRKQSASACFISSIDDTLDDIVRFQESEFTIFRGGSGSGVNLSDLRSSYEKLSAGSYTSGPLAFMKGSDQFAGAMKSGGATRNAAKMVVMDMDHPDVLATRDGRPGFITCKAVEEKLAHDLVSIGYSSNFDDPNGAYKRVSYQNANHSVSIPDSFMQAMIDNGQWQTKERLTGKVVHTYKARELWMEVAKAAWTCGDPGVQFTDIINKWHTTPKSGKIRASNPCFAAETKIATEFGLVSIADLYERIQDSEVKVAVHFGDHIEMRPAIIFPTGNNPLLNVKFRSGRVLCVTPNHNFLLRDGSKKPAADLIAGDSVDIQCGEGSFGKYDIGFPDDLTWYCIAGFVVGDGWMTKIKINSKQHRDNGWKSEFDRQEVGMCFGKDDKDILSKIESFLRTKEIPYTLKRQNGSVGESPDYLRIRRKAIFDMMEQIACPAGSRSHTKRIQPGVFEASRHNQLSFLSGLFSADGTFRMSAQGHNGHVPTREMRLSSTSLGLLQDVQALLLNLGIKSNIIKDRNTNRSGKFKYMTSSGEEKIYSSNMNIHELFVYGHSLRKLRDGIKEVGGMISDRKQAQLDDFLPNGYGDPIHDVWHDEVISVEDSGREELTYNMTEFDTHTIIAEGIRIPQCSEFLHIDNTACNLCAINLTKFFDGRKFSYERFYQSVRLFSTAQMAIVGKAEYPTEKIANNSHKLRPIGTNYGDLGALLMKLGYGYDSDEGRAVAARMASLMTAIVYLTSAKLAARVGAFSEFQKNREDMLRVMNMHKDADSLILTRWNQSHDHFGDDIQSKSSELWKEVISLGEKYGYNISQATLQAPLGTISFLMGMNTTGIEPAFSLVSYKSLVGGGFMKLTNSGVREALRNLGYGDELSDSICRYIEENDYIEGAPGFNNDHLPIFDCAMPSGPSGRYLTPMAHIKMMAAIQPLITCAQSKTVNLPTSVTPEEIADIYQESWRLGVKCIALYRDGCKASQPLSTKSAATNQPVASVAAPPAPPASVAAPVAPVAPPSPKKVSSQRPAPHREKMPSDVSGWRHKFVIDGYKGYILVYEYPDGRPGEIFLKLGKPGSTIAGLVDGFTQIVSIGLQYGIPLPKLIMSFIDTRFEPAGMTNNPEIRFAKSIFDYLFKVLDVHYFHGEHSGLSDKLKQLRQSESMTDVQEGISQDIDSETVVEPLTDAMDMAAKIIHSPKTRNLDAPPCARCGNMTQRNGSCYLCLSCGSTTGCS